MHSPRIILIDSKTCIIRSTSSSGNINRWHQKAHHHRLRRRVCNPDKRCSQRRPQRYPEKLPDKLPQKNIRQSYRRSCRRTPQRSPRRSARTHCLLMLPEKTQMDNDAKAFYGVVADGLKAHHAEPDESFDEEVGKLALGINMAIKSLARVDWRSSTAINKKMKQALDDLIWDFSDEHTLDLPPEEIDLFIENAMKTAMSRY